MLIEFAIRVMVGTLSTRLGNCWIPTLHTLTIDGTRNYLCDHDRIRNYIHAYI